MPERESPLSLEEEEIFDVAATLPAAERAAYLDAACAGDAAVRASVEELLASHDDNAFMERPATHTISPELSANMAEESGERIGNYNLLQKIGEGGFGTVWMAQQEHPVQRRVALKIIKPGMDTKEVITRFELERQALAMMDHPNIARVLDAGATPTGRPFFVMELVQGIRITDYCDQHNLPTANRLELFIAVCHAVQHAHQKGIIHRDLKPSNILVTMHDGVAVPKVIDFGVAKAMQQQPLTDRTLFTQLEQMIGTPAYMSPEQAEMMSQDIDTRSDIYSLGVLLYELLTGCTPFNQNELLAAGVNEMRRTIREVEPVKPSTRLTQERLTNCDSKKSAIRRGGGARDKRRQGNGRANPQSAIDNDLDWIVMKALEKDRARRYETASAFAADLQHFLAHEPVSAAAPSAAYRFRKFARRNRTALGVAATIAAILVGATVVSVRQARRAERAEKEVTAKLRDSYLVGARALRWSGRPGRRAEGLDALMKAAKIEPGIDLRTEAIACLALPDLRLVKRSRNFREPRGFVRVDARNDRYAVARADGNVDVCQLSNDELLIRLEGKSGTFPKRLHFSNDARWLTAWFEDNSCRLLDLASGRMLWEMRRDRDAVTADFLPDERRVAIKEANERQLTIYDLATEKRLQSFQLPFRAFHVRFSPNGTAFAFSSEKEKRVLVMDSANGETLLTLEHADGVYDLAWDPAGERLATGCRGNGVYLWDAKTGRQLARFGESLEILSVAFHPDGNIVAGSDYERTRLWEVRMGQQLATDTGAGLDLGFNRDGSLLTSLGWEHEMFNVFDVASGDECRAIDVNRQWIRFAFSPRLGLLAAWSSDRVLLFSEDVREALASLPAVQPGVFFDPSGTSLFICDDEGLWRWPVKSLGTGNIEIGPRQEVSLPRCKSWQLTGDGQAFVAGFDDRLEIYDATTLALRASTAIPRDETHPVTSPDGEWIAVGHWYREGVEVWNARTGKLARELPSATISMVSFSPDGRWLAVRDHRRTEFWTVGTWTSHLHVENTLGDAVGCPVAFTQNGRIAALRSERSKVLLIDTATGRELGLLESPNAHDINATCFVADDTRLVVSMDKNPMRVWDLRRIRQQLAAMNLDWEAPPLPAQPSKPVITSVKVLTDPSPEH